jgi:hypothetical protein
MNNFLSSAGKKKQEFAPTTPLFWAIVLLVAGKANEAAANERFVNILCRR